MAAFKTTPLVLPQAIQSSIVVRFILTSGRYLLSPSAQSYTQLRTQVRDVG